MRIQRQITHENESPYAGLGWKKVDVEICASDAAERVCLTDIEVPAHWSYGAAETFVRYYVRRTGVPIATVPVREEGVPEWLWRRVPDTAVLASRREEARTTHEVSAKQVFGRLVGMWTYWGFKAGYFDTEEDARAFHDETCALLARQMVAPNSPQWFNAGLHWAYGMTGPAQGHFYIEYDTGKLRRSTSAYEHPQLAACFLHSVKDDLVNEGGIMHLLERETRAFKYGSGAGANMSQIRGAGEDLSGGTGALGLMRFLGVGDKAAGAICAGGLPRRAGKMVVVDIDHPDVMQFIRWKGEEQYKAAALIVGARTMRKYLTGVMAAMHGEDEARFSPQHNPALKAAVSRARRAMVPQSAIERVIGYAKQGYTEMHIPVYSAADQSDVFFTVSAHQSHQAVRLTDRFLEAAEHREKINLRKRTDGGVHGQEDAAAMMEDLAHAVWATGEPTIHFADAIDRAHSCPESGAIRASTPASEYLFLDDTACPLAAINLLALADAKGHLDLALFAHAVRLSTLMLDISIGIAQYPSREMARLTHDTRPIGLGIVGTAALLARLGAAYDSEEGRATIAGICALLTGEAAALSAELARELGAFAEFSKNKSACLRQLQQRRTDTSALACPSDALAEAARRAWDIALVKTEAYGARNAQLTCVPPTSTIARVMDCETLGLLPLAGVVRFTPQQNGRLRKSLSANVLYGLRTLGYADQQLEEITHYVCGRGTLKGAPGIGHEQLRARGFGEAQLVAVEEVLAHAADIHTAFDPWNLGERFCREQLKLADAQMYDAQCRLLEWLGFSAQEIEQANRYACGTGSLRGAPHVAETDARVLAAGANAPAQIAMIAAAQRFLTSGIAHTIHLPQATTIDQCQELIWQAWHAGLKAVSFYREGCALYGNAEMETEDTEQDETIVFRQATASLPGGNITEIAAKLAQHWMSTRRELPLRRRGYTQKASIAGHTVYLRTGEYEDGMLGEIFLDMPDATKATRELAQQFARAISIALQYGVPLAAFIESFTRAQSSPVGEGEQMIEEAHALLDHVFRELATSYLAEAQETPSTHVLPFKAAAIN